MFLISCFCFKTSEEIAKRTTRQKMLRKNSSDFEISPKYYILSLRNISISNCLYIIRHKPLFHTTQISFLSHSCKFQCGGGFCTVVVSACFFTFHALQYRYGMVLSKETVLSFFIIVFCDVINNNEATLNFSAIFRQKRITHTSRHYLYYFKATQKTQHIE